MSGTRNLTGICQDIHRNRANVDTPPSGPSTSSRSGRYYRRLSQVQRYFHISGILQSLDEADRGIDVEELLVPLKHVLDILQSDEKEGNHYE